MEHLYDTILEIGTERMFLRHGAEEELQDYARRMQELLPSHTYEQSLARAKENKRRSRERLRTPSHEYYSPYASHLVSIMESEERDGIEGVLKRLPLREH